MSEIVKASLSVIDSNPMRRLDEYPFVENKIASLRKSIRDVGMWEGVIARKKGNRYEIAFGHHRIEAARRELGADAKVSIIVRDLDEEQMLQFMGRENLEDWNADFNCQLEAWEATADYLFRSSGQNPDAVDIARLLGWMRQTVRNGAPFEQLNDTAEACSAASRLIKGKYHTKEDYEGLVVDQVRKVTGAAVALQAETEKAGKARGSSAEDIEKGKKHVAKAARKVAKDTAKGRVAPKDIKNEVRGTAFKYAVKEKAGPLLEAAAKSLATSISKMLQTDAAANKLEEIYSSLDLVELPEDVTAVRYLGDHCGHLSKRADEWRRKLYEVKEPKAANVVDMPKQIAG